MYKIKEISEYYAFFYLFDYYDITIELNTDRSIYYVYNSKDVSVTVFLNRYPL